MLENENEELASFDQSNQTFSFHRLKTYLPTTISHGENEKHRIIFTVNKKVQFCGVGLQQIVSSLKVTMKLLKLVNGAGVYNELEFQGPMGPKF